MTTLQEDIEGGRDTLIAAANLLHAIVHGPDAGAGSLVTTENGDVKSVAKAVADLEAAYQIAADIFDAVANGPSSGAGSTVTTDSGEINTVARSIADLEAAYQQAADIFDAVANGPSSGAGSTVTTDSGEINTVARSIAELEAAYQASDVVSTVAASADLARAWAVEPEDQEVAAGQYSARHWAQKASFYAGTLSFGAHGLLRDSAGSLYWVSGDDPFAAHACDTWGLLTASAEFSINANGHLEVTF